jgi:hypothetical protein
MMKWSFRKVIEAYKSRLSFREFRKIYPEREWFLGVLLAVTFVCAGASYAYILFSSALKQVDEGVVSGDVALDVTYDEDLVVRMVQEYGARLERFKALDIKVVPEESSISTTTSGTSTPPKEESTVDLQTGGIKVE